MLLQWTRTDGRGWWRWPRRRHTSRLHLGSPCNQPSIIDPFIIGATVSTQLWRLWANKTSLDWKSFYWMREYQTLPVKQRPLKPWSCLIDDGNINDSSPHSRILILCTWNLSFLLIPLTSWPIFITYSSLKSHRWRDRGRSKPSPRYMGSARLWCHIRSDTEDRTIQGHHHAAQSGVNARWDESNEWRTT